MTETTRIRIQEIACRHRELSARWQQLLCSLGADMARPDANREHGIQSGTSRSSCPNCALPDADMQT